jgi:hypothetical protein
MDPDASIPTESAPSVFSYVLSFLLVGVAWGFTTPFIRRAAADFNARQDKQAKNSDSSERGRTRTQELLQTGFTDAGEEQELLSRGELDGDNDDGEDDGMMRRRSTSQSGQSHKAKGSVAGQHGDDAQGSSRDTELRDEGDDDDLPTPAWRRESGPKQSWLRTKAVSIFWTVVNLLRTPAYAIPLIINLTGSIWFFLLVGKHGMSFSPCKLSLLSPRLDMLMTFLLFFQRAFPHRPSCELECIPIYCAWRVVCGAQGDCEGDMVGHGLGAWRYCIVCSFKEPGFLIPVHFVLGLLSFDNCLSIYFCVLQTCIRSKHILVHLESEHRSPHSAYISVTGIHTNTTGACLTLPIQIILYFTQTDYFASKNPGSSHAVHRTSHIRLSPTPKLAQNNKPDPHIYK